MNQILLGVSTRGYESSLNRPLARVRSRGASKSAASRHLVTETRRKLSSYLSCRLEELDVLALMVDGIEIAGHTVVVSLGITGDGTKIPLGLWLGSTENAALCTSLLQDLLRRGLSRKAMDAPAPRHRVTLPLVGCAHEARPGEEMTPERVATLLLEEEAETARGPLR